MKLLAVPGYFRDSAFNFTLPPELENREALPFLQYAGGFVQRGCKFHPTQLLAYKGDIPNFGRGVKWQAVRSQLGVEASF